jgi:hypothetical protein
MLQVWANHRDGLASVLRTHHHRPLLVKTSERHDCFHHGRSARDGGGGTDVR